MKFIPLYDAAELDLMLRHWATRSLDSISSPYGVLPGVQGCDFSPQGLRPSRLLHRFTTADVERVLEGMGNAPDPSPRYAALLCIKALAHTPIQDLARSLEVDCMVAQEWLCSAQDEFMRRLLRTSPYSHNANIISSSMIHAS